MILTASILSLAARCKSEDIDDINAERMQQFVADISLYARERKPGFIIIPQNGLELAYSDTDPREGFKTSYMDAIDGIGIEELFYDKVLTKGKDLKERLSMALDISIKGRKVIMVADFVEDNDDLSNALELSKEKGFLAFPRANNNYDYKYIPSEAPLYPIPNENKKDIVTLSDAENYLYIINPDAFTDKADMINQLKGTNYDVILMDAFFEKKDADSGTLIHDAFTDGEIESLKTKSSGGKRLLIAYINIGSAEEFRYYWDPLWEVGNPSWIVKTYSEVYTDEYWVEFWHPAWQDIIFMGESSYMDQIIDAGFDGVYLDNVEAYYSISHDE